MTDRERVVTRLKKLIKTAHNDARDFVYVTVGTASVIVRLLEEQEPTETWYGMHGKQITMPAGTFEKIYNDNEEEKHK